MNQIFLCIVLLFSFGKEKSFAQSNSNLSNITVEEMFRPKMPNELDTLYYPFYNGVQMIEVDHIGYWDKKIFFLEQSEPRAIPHSVFHPMPVGNEYYFRDINGTILKAFNSGKSLEEINLSFKNIPIRKKTKGFGSLFKYHSNQKHRDGVWYQSPQSMFDFSGYYKVSNSYAAQSSLVNNSDLSGKKMVKFGLIDSFGNIVIPIEYNVITPYYKNLLVQKASKCGMIDYENNEIVPLVYDNYDFDYYDQNKNQDKKANVFFLTIKDTVNYNPSYYYKSVYKVVEKKLLMLDNYDEVKHDFTWSPYNDTSKRLIPVTKNNKTGYLNEHYQEIVPPLFEIFEYNRNVKGLFRVSKNGKFGFWNTNFKEIIPLEYDYAEAFKNESTALVLKNKKFYTIDSKNNEIANGIKTPTYNLSYINFVSDENFIAVQVGSFLGVIDSSTNAIILPFIYSKTLTPLQFNSFFEKNKFLLEEKKLALSEKADMIDEILFHQNKIIVKNANNQFGLIDSTFQVIVDFKYDTLEPIACNLKYLLISQNGKFSAMDYKENKLLSQEYEEVKYDIHYKQERDIFKIKKNGKWGVVNFEDKIIIPFEYDSIKFLGHWNREKEKLWVVEKNKKFGVVDVNNKIFIPFEYHGISHLEGNNLWVNDENKVRYKVVLKN